MCTITSHNTNELESTILSDDDVLANIEREHAVHTDVQEALARLASALSSASNPMVLGAIRQRLNERNEACADLAKAVAEAETEKEERLLVDKARADTEATLRRQAEDIKSALEEAEKNHSDSMREVEATAAVTNEEITCLRDKVSAAEGQAKHWQQKAKAGESRAKAMQAEVGALHEAMAGLHGEMGAIQRELDETKASQDKLAKDLLRAEGKERKAEETLSEVLDKAREADKRLRKEGSERERLSNELNKMLKLRDAERLSLTAEAERHMDGLAKYKDSSEKLKATNRDLNALLQRLSVELEEARTAAGAGAKRADASAAAAEQKELELNRLTEKLAQTEADLAAAIRERNETKESLQRAINETQASLTDVERHRGELALLEGEKHDLILDVQERVKTLKEAAAEVERHQQLNAVMQRKQELEVSARIAAESRGKTALDDLTEAKRTTAMQDERIEALRSELGSLRRTLEQTADAAKASDKESAQRLVQLSQTNAKLSTECTGAKGRLIEAEEMAEKRSHQLEDLAKALAKAKEDGKHAAASVQRLEEEVEVADARWHAAQGQVEAANLREKKSAEEASHKVREALDAKGRDMEAAVREEQASTQHRLMEAEATRRAAERTYKHNMAAIQDDAKKRLAQEEAKRVREVTEARRKSKAMAGALQALQDDLRNSQAKGCGLERQVSQLSARVHKAGGGLTGGSGSTSRSCSSGDSRSAMEGIDITRGAEVTEAEIASLRRQMRAATQAKEIAEKGASEARSLVEEETRRRSSAEDSLCRKEREMVVALERLDKTKQRLQEAEESAGDTEEDLRSLVRQRDSEIEGLSRRNQVLSDTLSRLTSDTDLDSHIDTSGASAPRGHIDGGGATPPIQSTEGPRGTRGNGLGPSGSPVVPRLGGGSELGDSLGESWQNVITSSFSPGGGSSIEASLGALADCDVGFEPPAPPINENQRGKWRRTNQLARESNNALDAVSSGPSTVAVGQGRKMIGSEGDDIRRRDGYRDGSNDNMHGTDVGKTGVLHGVSAAIASRALREQNGTRPCHDIAPIEGSLNNFEERDNQNVWKGNNRGILDVEQRELGATLSTEWALGIGGNKGTKPSKRDDDRVRLARKHVDQALRERALRRRHSGGELMAADREHPFGKREVRTHGQKCDPAAPARLRPEMGVIHTDLPKGGGRSVERGSTRAALDVPEGNDQIRSINLGDFAQRNRLSSTHSLKQDASGRSSGGKSNPSRSTATAAMVNGFHGATAAKSAAVVRVYGTPQNSR